MNILAIEPIEALISAAELIEYLQQFPGDSWIEYKHSHKSRRHENTIRLDRDIDTNIVTITFE